MDDLLKRLADVGLALTAAEEALDSDAPSSAQDHLDLASDGLAALRERWPELSAAQRKMVGRAAGPLRDRLDAAARRVPRRVALSLVAPEPGEEDEDEEEPDGPEEPRPSPGPAAA